MIVGIAGYARAGKDSVGHILVTEFGFQRVAFADVMKRAAAELDPIIDWYGGLTARPVYLHEVLASTGWEGAKSHVEVRRLLQRLGTEVGRKIFGEDFWVEQTLGGLDLTQDWVVTDVRFVNEAQRIKDLGGQVWRIDRPGVVAPNDHPSEHALEGWIYDVLIHNTGSLDELAETITGAIKVTVGGGSHF